MRRQDVIVVPFSGQADLRDNRRHFPIDASHPAFEHTGLKKSCYIAADHLMSIARENLNKRLGRLSGPLAGDFARFLVSFLFADQFVMNEGHETG